jgi:ribosomal protein L10
MTMMDPKQVEKFIKEMQKNDKKIIDEAMKQYGEQNAQAMGVGSQAVAGTIRLRSRTVAVVAQALQAPVAGLKRPLWVEVLLVEKRVRHRLPLEGRARPECLAR